MQIDLCVLGHAVRVTTKDETVGRAIDLFWEPAKVDPDPKPEVKKRRFDYVFEAERLYFRGEIVARGESEHELLGAFERHLLDTLISAGRDTCLLHAGAVLLNQDLFVLIGPSGAGKSTLTRLLVEAGASYLADDLVSLGGEWLDGASRSVQFDALMDEALPDYLSDCVLVDYPAPGFAPGALRVPVHRGSYRALGPVRHADKRVVLLRLEHGLRNELSTLSALERLAGLHAATIVGGQAYSGGLDHGLGFALEWAEPESALGDLLRSIGSDGARTGEAGSDESVGSEAFGDAISGEAG